ncbi:MAG: methylenetetrahydrofolate reductase C-terminal domain-containing protein [Chloroflexota bacterium]
MSFLQNHPRVLQIGYDVTLRLLRPLRRWLRPGGWAEGVFVAGERLTKGPLFDCRMCGQCVLHYTGMTCPMTCPRDMRNGPCGGVRLDGNCEVRPEMRCVWVLAWQRSRRMPAYGQEIRRILPPLDRRREGHSAWILELNERPGLPRVGWSE